MSLPAEMAKLPATTARLQVVQQNFSQGLCMGQVNAGGFAWTFRWDFKRGELEVNPPLGRALIQDALLRFLLHHDYQLEVGSDYQFTVRARF